MKKTKLKSQSINILNKEKFKETLTKLENANMDIIEEYEAYIKDLVIDLNRQEKMKTLEKNKKKKEKISISFHIVQYILKKRKRSNDELLILKYFLSEMDFISLLKADIGKDKLLYSLSRYLRLEKRSQNSIVFRYGNKGNKFYIVFSGELSVLILKEIKVQISYLRYIIHLIILKLLKEDDLVNKTISSNFGINKVNQIEFDSYYDNLTKFVNKHFGKFSNKNRYFIFQDSNKNSIKNNNTLPQNILYNDAIHNLDIILDSDFSSDEEENKNEKEDDDDEDENNEERKGFEFREGEYMRIKNKTDKKFKRRKILKKNPILSNIYNINKKLNYEEILINRLQKKELKYLVIYFIFCRELISCKKIFSSIQDYIDFTYLNSPMHLSMDFDCNSSKKEQFSLFQYFEIAKKSKGDTFGELALQHSDNKRTATIMTISDSVLGYLSRSDYNLSISNIELKKRKKDVNFIMSFSIFSQMNWFVFENKYFNYFKKEIIFKNEKILEQGQKNSKLFFILAGQFELKTSMTFKKLYSFLRLKLGNNFDIMPAPSNINNKINTFKICIAYDKDLLGLQDCYYYNDISFIDATCISTKSIVLSVDISILNEMKEKNPEIKIDLKNLMIKRNEIMIERLKKIYYKNLESFQYFKTERNISTPFYHKRIKLYLNDKDDFNRIVINNKILRDDKNNDDEINSKITNIKKANLNLNLIKFLSYDNKNLFTKNTKKIDTKPEDTNKKTEYLDSIEFNNEILKEYNKTFQNNLKSDFPCLSFNKNNNEKNINSTNKNNETIENKKIDKIKQIMKLKNYSSSKKKNQYLLKTSNELDKININHTYIKLNKLYSPINKIITKEYSNLFNWIEGNYNSRNSARINIRYNTEGKLISCENSHKNDNKKIKKFYKKTFSSKITNPIKINIKKIINRNNKLKTKLTEEKNNIISDSLIQDQIKRKTLSLNNKRHNNNSFTNKKKGNKIKLNFREKNLKRLFDKFITNSTTVKNKSNSKKLNFNHKNLKLNIISNIDQFTNLSKLFNKKTNFFLCSENTKKEYGFKPNKIYFNNNINNYIFSHNSQEVKSRNEYTKIK